MGYIKSKNKSINIPNFSSFLSWDLYSKEGKIVKGELVYKARNFSWTTVYRLKMLNEEKGELIAEAVVSNNSDLGFKNVDLQLVEGNLNRPKMKYPRPEKMSRSLSASNDILNMSKNELGDYYIYSLNNQLIRC